MAKADISQRASLMIWFSCFLANRCLICDQRQQIVVIFSCLWGGRCSNRLKLCYHKLNYNPVRGVSLSLSRSLPHLSRCNMWCCKSKKRTKDILLNRVLTSGIGRKRLIESRVFSLRPVNPRCLSAVINIQSFIPKWMGVEKRFERLGFINF